MLHWTSGIATALVAAMLSPLHSGAPRAQDVVPCEQYHSFSREAASNSLALAMSAMMSGVTGCSGDDWYICDGMRNDLYKSEENLAIVFNQTAVGKDNADGSDCLKCDLAGLMFTANLVYSMGDALNRMGFETRTGNIYRSIAQSSALPLCPAATPTPPPTVTAAVTEARHPWEGLSEAQIRKTTTPLFHFAQVPFTVVDVYADPVTEEEIILQGGHRVAFDLEARLAEYLLQSEDRPASGAFYVVQIYKHKARNDWLSVKWYRR